MGSELTARPPAASPVSFSPARSQGIKRVRGGMGKGRKRRGVACVGQVEGSHQSLEQRTNVQHVPRDHAAIAANRRHGCR